eukprot:5645552-Amphidinium_carterae.1
MSRDGVLRFWATVCQQSPDTVVGAQVWGCGEGETLSIVGDVMAGEGYSNAHQEAQLAANFPEMGRFPLLPSGRSGALQ